MKLFTFASISDVETRIWAIQLKRWITFALQILL